jgi:hypothetical protein
MRQRDTPEENLDTVKLTNRAVQPRQTPVSWVITDKQSMWSALVSTSVDRGEPRRRQYDHWSLWSLAPILQLFKRAHIEYIVL